MGVIPEKGDMRKIISELQVSMLKANFSGLNALRVEGTKSSPKAITQQCRKDLTRNYVVASANGPPVAKNILDREKRRPKDPIKVEKFSNLKPKINRIRTIQENVIYRVLSLVARHREPN